MLTATERDLYDETRRKFPTYPARHALQAARAEVALRAAEDAGLIRFHEEYDPDPMNVSEWGWDEHAERKYREDMEAGRIVVYIVTAEAKREQRCPRCGEVIGTEWESASVGNVDVYVEDESYVREVQRDLARELGVIA